MAGPGVVQGQTANACSLVDLSPTVVEIFGGSADMFGMPVDVRSLMPLARGEDDGISEAIGEYCAEMTGHPVFMIRRGDMNIFITTAIRRSCMIWPMILGRLKTWLTFRPMRSSQMD